MTKHTPGPWFIGTDFSDQGRHVYAEKMVCDDEGEEWHPLIASTDDDERLIDWQANARLIAAAPDLLAALMKIIGDKPKEDVFGYSAAHNAMDNENRAAAAAAIAKATQEPAA